jgi:nicotinate-nucleotide--dimethylbenzimidazole phosphoribosyltransferase
VPPASFAEVRALLARLPAPDEAARAAAARRQLRLTKPPGALGRLEDLACWLAAWQGREVPRLDRVLTLVFAGNHGVAARGVSAFPAAVTAQMVANFEAGGAAINQLSRLAGAELRVHALSLDRPTADFTVAPALSEAGCLEAFAAGFMAVPDGLDLLLLGEMGIANTTAAAALAAALMGGAAADWVGPGTGLDAAGVLRKAEVVAAGLARHRRLIGDPLQALRCLGGRELAALAGAVLAARLRPVPVLLDGYVVTAAAAVLWALAPAALAHAQAGHRSAEPAHRALLERLGLTPILDLGMRLGEASGAAVAALVLRAAVATHAGMATFEAAGVSGRDGG